MDPMLDHAITNVIFRYRQINKDMPVTEIGRRFRALWTAIDHLIHHYEKDTAASETDAPHHHPTTPDRH